MGSLIELVVFKQPELAETLKAIAGKGATEFYKGETAQKIVADVQANGGSQLSKTLQNTPPIGLSHFR